MKVLITGGTGWVGQWMQHEAPVDAELVVLNHTQYDTLPWDQDDYDYIIHLAIVDPQRVIECAKRCGARVLFSSSGAVYHAVLNDYGKQKVESERMFAESGIDFVTVRIFALAGAFMKWNNFALGCFIRDAVAGGPINIQGDGLTIRSYLYGEDMARWMWKALFQGRSGVAYDVGSEYGVTIADLARMIASNFDPQPKVIIHGKIAKEQAPVYLPVDVYKTKNELQVIENYLLEDMIRLTIDAYRREKNV
jgi:nucleoside-diphosphate-sugar epimerase